MLSSFQRFLPVYLSVVFASSAFGPAHGQQAPDKKPPPAPITAEDVTDLKKQLGAVQAELAEIKQMLAAQRATLPAAATRANQATPKADQHMTLPFVPSHSLGSADSPFVLVEFGDLQCPFCNDFAKRTLPSFQRTYVDTGKVRFLNVEFPLESHPNSGQLSTAAICAGQNGKYWEMRQALMKPDAPSPSAAIETAAQQLGIDNPAFEGCLESTAVSKELSNQVSLARQAGVYSTPTFLLGRVKDGSIAGISFVGDLSPDEFNQQVEAAMKQITGAKDEKQIATAAPR